MVDIRHRNIGIAVGIGIVTVLALFWGVVYKTTSMTAQESKLLQTGFREPITKEDGVYGRYQNPTNRVLSMVIVSLSYTSDTGAKIADDSFTTSNLKPGQMWEFKMRLPKGAKGMEPPTVTAY